ncbi:alpha/beta hydrolase [Halapricum desulfuricans]|uniref:Putative esterase n=1 Tax=Halapricum desulfuricans TaxID=2841257 RepID=A0A897NLR3_9EURY|nr:dienelactone hydrolase family protein [Halapricum desulfuricans]QSG15430.1 putative esterase [Halapricum desulfuricans]
MHDSDSPHQDQPLTTAGSNLDDADAAAILLHGRGATAQSVLQLTDHFEVENIAYLAPQAAGNTWYPNPFTAPVESNEPGRTSGLRAIGGAISEAESAGIPTANTVSLGFSQGACLASEFAARNPDRYGGVVALSGGLIGESIDLEAYDGDLDGTPVFLGCSDSDPHIPAERVRESAAVFERLGGDVTKRLYEGMGHGINDDEIEFVSGLLADL